jgi:hypothetical protein
MSILAGALMLIGLISSAAPRTRGLALIALGFLLWMNPGIFVAALILSGIFWYAISRTK